MFIIGFLASAVVKAFKTFFSTLDGKIYTSDNNTSYSLAFNGTDQINDIAFVSKDASAFDSDKYLAAANNGKLLVSDDASSWTTLNAGYGSTENVRAVDFFNEDISRAQVWSTVFSTFGTSTIVSLAFGDGVWVAGGNNGQMRISTRTDKLFFDSVTSTFGATTIQAIAFGNGVWVAGGLSGQMRRSDNASTWSTVVSNFGTSTIASISFGNNTWIAGGGAGKIAVSTDTTNWSAVTSNFGATFIQTVAFGNEAWVAAGNSGQMRISTDATNWATVTSNFGTSTINSVLFANNQWVAVGNNGNVRVSTDIVTWTSTGVVTGFGTSGLGSLTFGNNIWLLATSTGRIFSSTDALTWVTSSSPNFLNSSTINRMAFGNNTFLAVGPHGNMRSSGIYQNTKKFIAASRGNKIRISEDLISWTTMPINNFFPILDQSGYETILNNNIVSVVSDRDTEYKTQVIVGENGLLIQKNIDNPNYVNVFYPPMSSSSSINSIQTSQIENIAYGNGIWLTADLQKAMQSTDGNTWTTSTLGSLGTSMGGIANGNSRWVVGASSTGVLRTSTDNVNWTSVVSNFAATISAISSIGFGTSTFVAVGNAGNIRTSTNGISWATAVSNYGTGLISSVKFGNGRWLAGGDSGILITSTNATTWTSIATLTFEGTPINIQSIEFGNNLWVVGGISSSNAQLRISTNAVNWTTVESTIEPSVNANIRTIVYNTNNGIWTLGSNGANARVSTNATSWATLTTRFESSTGRAAINSMAYTSDSLIMVGAGVPGVMEKFNTTSKPALTNFSNNGVFLKNNKLYFIDTSNKLNTSDLVDFSDQNLIQNNASLIWKNGLGGLANGFDDMTYVDPIWVATSTLSDSPYISFTGENWIEKRFVTGTTPMRVSKIVYDPNSDLILFGRTLPVFASIISSVSKKNLIASGYSSADQTDNIVPITQAGNIRSINYLNGLWIVGGSGSSIATSTNAINWTNRLIGLDTRTPYEVRSVAYGQSTFVAALGGSATSPILTSTDSLTWEEKDVFASGNYNSVIFASNIFNNDVWVASGASGRLRTSTNLISWTSRASGFGNSTITSLASGNNLFVAGGSNGQISTSTNSVNWVSVTSNFGTTSINSMSFGNNTFVAGGNSGQVRSSLDGIVWNSSVVSNFGATNITSVVFQNGIFVAAGESGQIRTSSNGTGWTTATSNFGTSTVFALGFGNGRWLAGGNASQSIQSTNNNASTWSGASINFLSPLPVSFISGAYGNSRFVFGSGSGHIVSSTDTVNWVTVISPGFGVSAVNSIFFGNNLFVAGGSNGQIKTSTDTINWNQSITSNFGTTIINSIVFGGGRWMAIGESGQMRTSTNAINWTTISPNFGSQNIRSIVFANNLWVAGSGRENQLVRPQISTSTNGVNWVTVPNNANGPIKSLAYGKRKDLNVFMMSTEFSSTTSNIQYSDNLTHNIDNTISYAKITKNGAGVIKNPEKIIQHDDSANSFITYNVDTNNVNNINNVYKFKNRNEIVAITNSGVFISDGKINQITPVTETSGLTYSNFLLSSIIERSALSIINANGEFLAGDTRGSVYRLSQNLSWSTVLNFGSSNVNALSFGNSTFIAGFSNGQMRTSTDTTNWSAVTSNFGTTSINSIAFGNGIWLAVGNTGQMRSSVNSSTWVTVVSNFGTTNIRKIKYSNNIWVAVGNSGQIRRSEDGVTWSAVSSGLGTINALDFGNNLWVIGSTAGNIGISTDAVTWTSSGVVSNFGSASVDAVAFVNNRWIAGASSGQLRISTDALSWTTFLSDFSDNIASSGYSSPGISEIAAAGNGIIIGTRRSNIVFSEIKEQLSFNYVVPNIDNVSDFELLA
jgi:hypothetical protein